ncbi:MAG: hypothetical protein WBE26_01975 [Phycisphaerae bacterium]
MKSCGLAVGRGVDDPPAPATGETGGGRVVFAERCAMGVVSTLRWAVVYYTILAALFGWLAVPTAMASEEDGETSTSPPPKYLSLDHLDAYLEFKGEFAYTKVESSVRQGFDRNRTQRNRDWGFEERIGLQFGGTILEPDFITFSGDLSFALTQDRFEEDTDFYDHTDEDNGYLVQFDLRANFFAGKAFSGSVYGLRQEDRINRRFQPTLNQRRTGFGTNWVFSHDKVPMELSYDYLETDRTGNADYSDDEHYTESTLRYAVDWLIADHHRFKFSYEHAETKQEYQGLYEPFETTRDLFNIEHQLEFGDEHQHTLRTLAHWQEESGDFARDLFEIGPQLTLKHSDNLRTLYEYQFNRERYEGLDIETHRADFQLIHQMYSNLTTTVDVFGLYEDVEDDINTTQYGASVDWQYNRRNRFGHLYANLALAYDTEEVDGDNGRRIILDEAHAFRDPIAIILRNRNVIPTSVVVTDTTNRRIYRIGVDYAMLQQGNVTRIGRVRTGQIADGDTVLVDYQIRTPTDGRLDTIRVDFSLEQRFTNGLTPYYRLSYRNQEDDTSEGFLRRADRTNHHRLGVNYEAKRYSLSAEFEIFDDTVDPYDAFHINGLLHMLQGQDHTLDASARLSRLFFEGGVDDRNVTMLDVELDHRCRLADSLSTVGRVAYRLEEDSIDGTTHAWDVTAGLEYAMGDLSGELTFEYDRLDLPHSEEDNYGVYLRLRRELPDVLGRR